jgi:hypothetical protein
LESFNITEIYSNVIAHHLNRYGPSLMVTTKEEVAYVAKNQANSGSSGKVAAGGR